MKFLLIFSIIIQTFVFSSEDEINIRGDIEVAKRIIGGRLARTNEVPYQVGLRRKGTGRTSGGGVIIDDHWVLTAGHCVFNEEKKRRWKNEELELIVGVNDQREAKEGTPFVVHVEDAFAHPDYQGGGRNDIALIKTKESLIVNSNGIISRKANLPKEGQQFTGQTGIASGRGATDRPKGSPGSDIVKVADMPILSTQECLKFDGGFNKAVPDSNICGHGRNQEDVGPGDSGGPIVIKNGNDFTVIGISSYIVGNGSFFTQVSHFINFIRDGMRK